MGFFLERILEFCFFFPIMLIYYSWGRNRKLSIHSGLHQIHGCALAWLCSSAGKEATKGVDLGVGEALPSLAPFQACLGPLSPSFLSTWFHDVSQVWFIFYCLNKSFFISFFSTNSIAKIWSQLSAHSTFFSMETLCTTIQDESKFRRYLSNCLCPLSFLSPKSCTFQCIDLSPAW